MGSKAYVSKRFTKTTGQSVGGGGADEPKGGETMGQQGRVGEGQRRCERVREGIRGLVRCGRSGKDVGRLG